MQTKAPRGVSRLAYACSIAAVCMVLAACGGGGGASTSAGGGASTSPSSGPSADSFPVTIQNCGHTLTFDKPPSRAVLPYHGVAEIFVGLGLADRAIGRAGWSGGTNQIVEVSQKVSGEPKVKVIAYGGGEGPLNLDGGRTSITTQIIEAAGGENVFADQNRFFEASLEAVAAKQADAFLIYASSKEPATKLEQFLFTAFPNMQASKDRRVIVSDYMFTSPGWRNAQTVEDFARQLHPDAFK